MNQLYVIQADDDPYCAPWAYGICTTIEEAMKHAQECDTFRCIEPFTLQNGVFKQTGKYFDENGNQVDYKGRPLNKEEFDDEINEALRIAGVQLNEHWDDPRPVDESNPVGRIYANNMGDKYYVSYFYKEDWSEDTEITLVSEANTENFYDMTEFEEFLSDMDLKFIGYVKNYGEIPGEYTLDPQ